MLFPYFGGKARVAPQVWAHLGDPEVYIEPFAGSLAVLFARPTPARTEIAVDLDGLIINFWRTIKLDPWAMSAYLTGAVSEIDVYAKHQALLEQRDVVNEKLRADPDWHNPMLAAWWWEGISSWLGSGYGHRLARQRPHIDRSLKGVWATGMTDEKIQIATQRLGNVILLAGDWKDAWKRAVTPAIIKRFNRGVGVFLDPPYTHATDRAKGLYAEDAPLNEQITEWALEQPEHVRVVIAGYDDEYPGLRGWDAVAWKAPNGYAQDGNKRRANEVLYLSPTRRRRLVRRGTSSLPGGSSREDRGAGQPAAGDDDGLGQDGNGDRRRPAAPKSAGGRSRVRVRPQVDQVAVGEGDPEVGPTSNGPSRGRRPVRKTHRHPAG